MAENKTIMSANCGATECGAHPGAAHSSEKSPQIPVQELHPIKVKFRYKLINFICATIALSWFFEGWRKVNEAITLSHVGILAAGTVLTFLFIAIHSYWAYVEEKHKGTLKKRIELFEKIYAASQRRCEANAVSHQNQLETGDAAKAIREGGEN